MENNSMPQFPESYWISSTEIPVYPKLNEDREANIVIAGGGITGLTAAYLLAKQGADVILLEAGRILTGTTGHTTAKVTAQHGLIYDELIRNFGVEKASLYYQANAEALEFMRQLVKTEQIDCHFTDQDAYVYTNSSDQLQSLLDEYEAYQQVGAKHSAYLEKIDLPVEHKAAIVLRQQAQFHPLEYMKHLAISFTNLGGRIYEQTTVTSMEEGDKPSIKTRDGYTVRCNKLIIATHFPFYDLKGFYFSRLEPTRSYILAVKTEKTFPGGMYISAEKPTHSLRSADMNGEAVVLFGGYDHPVGKDENTHQNYERLGKFAHDTFGVREIPFRWSAQDPSTLDQIPFVGRYSPTSENVYVATGYRKWGMTNGTAAALLLADLVMGKENRYSSLFDPNRFHADPDVKKFIQLNAGVAKELVKGKLDKPDVDPNNLENDQGAAVTINGKRAGAYRDQNGILHLVDTTCSHLGCEVKWNNGERTWDCPCHGSRFSFDGEVLEGPAETPLKRITEADSR